MPNDGIRRAVAGVSSKRMLPLLAGTSFGLVVGLVVWLFQRLRARARAVRVRARLGDVTKASALAERSPGALVALSGKLRVRSPGKTTRLTTFFPFGVSLSEKPSSEAITLDWASGLELSVDDVELAGDAQVVLGSRETSLRASESEARAFGVSRMAEDGMLRGVASGDEVIVRGKLERVASEVGDDYRTSSVRHRLVGDAANVLAVASATTPRPAGKRAYVLPIALGALVAASVPLTTPSPRPMPPAGAAASRAPTAPPSCAAEIDALLARGNPWRAEKRLASCDWRMSAARVAVHLADFPRASRAFADARERGEPVDPTVTEIETHLFAGNDALAREVTKKLREAHYPSYPPASLFCVEGAFGRRAGQPDGAELLARTAATPRAGEGCDLLSDDFALVPFVTKSERRAYFVAERTPQHLHWLLKENEVLNRHVGLFGVASVVVNEPTSRVTRNVPLAAAALRTLAPKQDDYKGDYQPLFAARMAADVALFDVVMGERDAAEASFAALDWLAPTASDAAYERRIATFYDRNVGIQYEWPRLELARLLMSYAAGIALHAGDETRMKAYLAASDHGAGEDALWRWVAQTKPADRTLPLDHWNQALAAATSGKGGDVVKALREARSTGRGALPRIVPKITTEREALVAWLYDDFPPADLRNGILALATNIGDRREAARVLGDTALEEKWAPVARALHAAVLRRDGGPMWIAVEEAVSR